MPRRAAPRSLRSGSSHRLTRPATNASDADREDENARRTWAARARPARRLLPRPAESSTGIPRVSLFQDPDMRTSGAYAWREGARHIDQFGFAD
jgi:hypothetical protein